MELKKNFGARLKELRKSKKWTQEQLAEFTGVDAKHISFLETGRNFPSADLLEKFKCVLDVDYKDIFDFSDNFDKEKTIKRINKMFTNMTAEQIQFIYKIVLEYNKI